VALKEINMILNAYFNNIGETGQVPQIIYINTNDSYAEVTTVGYLNSLIKKQQLPISQEYIALVTTKTSPAAKDTQTTFFMITFFAGNWSLEAPAASIKFAKQVPIAGGSAIASAFVPGLLATDLVFVQMVNDGSNNVTILSVVASANSFQINFSGDPGAGCIINYQVLRSTT